MMQPDVIRVLRWPNVHLVGSEWKGKFKRKTYVV